VSARATTNDQRPTTDASTRGKCDVELDVGEEEMKRARLVSLGRLLVTLAVACGACDDAPPPAMGGEGDPCYPNGTCDEGLECDEADICVAAEPSPCAGVDCSGHGVCAVSGEEPVCACDEGYHAVALDCVADDPGDPCLEVTCSGHGVCAVAAGEALCLCDEGYHAADLGCLADDPGPCLDVTCSDHGVCAVAGGAALCVCDEGFHPDELACVGNDPDDPCAGIDCAGHGACDDSGGAPACDCDEGFHAVSLACIADEVDPCLEVTCSGHGVCAVAGGAALCVCDEGFHAAALECAADAPDPCLDVVCSGHGICAAAAGEPLCICDEGFHAEALECVADPPDPCLDVDCSGHGFCAVAASEPLCVCDDGYHDEALECLEDDSCTNVFADDFEDGVLAPWTAVAGEVSVTGGRLRVVRTGSRWGEAEVALGATLDGAWEVEVEMELLTAQSVVSLCVQAPGAAVHYYCLTLNTKTENGSTRGAHLFVDTMVDNVGVPPASELIEYAFDPGVGVPHLLRLTRSAAGLFELFVDGTSRGTATNAALTTFDRLHVYGMQDTSGGHGGFLDDVMICQ
jgi:hypothetical protein